MPSTLVSIMAAEETVEFVPDRVARTAMQGRTTSRSDEVVRQLQVQADRLCEVGAHWRAEPLLAQALAIVVEGLGQSHPGIAVHLDRLARCRMQAGHLAAALADFQRLSALMDCTAVTVDPQLADTPQFIAQCTEALRVRDATAKLQQVLTPMLTQARSQRTVGESRDQERVRLVARRLIARGRLSLGARLLEDWLHMIARGGQLIEADAVADIRDHALALWSIGETASAGRVLGALAKACHPVAALQPALMQILEDWASCLAAQGLHVSARETAALAWVIRSTDGEPTDQLNF